MFDFIKDPIHEVAVKRELSKKGMLQNNDRLPVKKSMIVELFERSKVVCFVMLILVLLTSVCVLTLPEEDGIGGRLVEKQFAPRTIYAAFDFTTVDTSKTRAAKDAMAAQVPFYYAMKPGYLDRIGVSLRDLTAEIRKRGDYEGKGALYQSAPGNEISDLVYRMDAPLFNFLLQIADNPPQKKKFLELVDSNLSEGIVSKTDKDNLPWGRQIKIVDLHKRVRAAKLLKDCSAPGEAAQIIADKMLESYTGENRDSLQRSLTLLLTAIFKEGNLTYDRILTEDRRTEAEATVKPIMLEILKGQPIIEKDHEIKASDLDLLQAYKEELKKRDVQISVYYKISENIAISVLLMLFTGIYIYHIHPEVVHNNRSIWLLGLMTIIALLADRLFVGAFRLLSEHESVPPQLLFLSLPLGLCSMVISVIYGMRSALYAGLYVSAIAALGTGNSFATVVLGLLVSGIGGFAVRYSSNYKSYFIRGFLTCTFTTFIIGIIFLWKDRNAPGMLEWGLILPIATGLATAIIAQMVLFIFEYSFDVSTNMGLLSYSDYNHPLLKRLQFEAPGTYHHSLMVSTLAEQAAQELRANPIRARVCALFHDVGKLAQPDYFTENSPESDEKHKELNPRVSSLVILNHVKEGVDLARKYKLKRLIRDAIEQHHGTDLVYYFYKRALDSSGEKSISEQEFRYPGPLPREKEIVIVSLADCCEAACRSLQKPTHGKIDALIGEIFRKKIREGQLDRAELTFRELAQLRKIFARLLTTMHHGRIAYPKEDEEKNEDDLFVAAGEKISRAGNQSAEEIDPENGGRSRNGVAGA